MPIQLKEEDNGRLIVFHVSGILTKEDYDLILPQAKTLLRQHGTLRVLFEMTDFHGWEPAALWEELKFDWAQFSDLSSFDRCAMVGDRKWESIMATLSKPFTSAEIRYFDHTDLAGARKWLDESPLHLAKAKMGSAAVRALAVGAVAFCATAIGALAVGALAIGRLRVLEARIEKLSIGTLTVDHLDVRSR
jgi:hypothetical protein